MTYHLGEAGIAYQGTTLAAIGGTPPYGWAVTGGALPAGLSLSPAGQITGTPTASGHFNFTVQVTDAASATASTPGSIGVYAPLALGALCASQCNVEEGCTVCGTFGSANGGVAPYNISVVGGQLPAGMSLGGLTVHGAFPLAGPIGAWNFTVQVTDQFGATGQVTATFYVFPHILLSTNKITCTQGSAQCVIQVGYSGGTPGGTPAVTVGGFPNPPGPPPNGYTVSASGGTLTFQANGQSYSNTVTITLTDQSLCGPGSAHCSASLFVTINL